MKKIFISHAFKDPEKINKDIYKLRDKLLTDIKDSVVTFDAEDLKYGDSIDYFMSNNIQDSCCAICVCTPEYLVSSKIQGSGVYREINLLLKKFNEYPKYKIYTLIPCGDFDASVPPLLKDFYTDKFMVNEEDSLFEYLNSSDFFNVIKSDIDNFILNADKFITNIYLVDLNPDIKIKTYKNGCLKYSGFQKDYQIIFKIKNISSEPLKVELLGLRDNYGEHNKLSGYNEYLHEHRIVRSSFFDPSDAIISFDIITTSKINIYFNINPNPESGYSDENSFDIEFKINDEIFRTNFRRATRKQTISLVFNKDLT